MAITQLYKPRKVAEILDLAWYEPYRLAASGTLPSYRLAANAIRFDAQDLVKFAKMRGIEPKQVLEPRWTPSKGGTILVEEAAMMLDVSKFYVYELIKRGDLNPDLGPPTGGHSGTNRQVYYLSLDEIMEWVESKRRDRNQEKDISGKEQAVG